MSGDHGSGHKQFGVDVVTELVEVTHPGPQITLLDSLGQALPRGSVANRGHRHDGVCGAAAVRVVGVPKQARIVAVAEHGHPAASERSLELVFGAPAHLVHLMHEQHAETSQARALHLDSDAENLVSSKG